MGEYKELPTGTNEILNKARRLLVARSGKSRVARTPSSGRASAARQALRRAENCRDSPGWAGEGTRPNVVLGFDTTYEIFVRFSLY